MKRTLKNYTFNAAAKTVTFTDFTSIRLESILLITNVTGGRNTIIYQLTDPLKGGSVTTNVLTLASITTGQADTDSLNIVFEDLVPSVAISVANSTATNLALNAVFTGTSEDISAYSNIKVSVFSSHASVTDGLQIQQSSDNVNWDSLDVYTIPATSGKNFSVPVNLRFFRIVYTNGATATTAFRLQVIFSTQDKQPSSVRPQDSRGNDNDCVETLSYLMGYNSTANAWNRVGVSNATTGGNENLIDRIKINASLRMIDNAQASGSKLVGVTGTQASGLDVNIKNTVLPVSGTFFQATQPVSIATNTPVIASGANSIGNINELRAATLAVTVTAAVGTAATLTLPAVAGQFHYITALDIVLYSAAARTGSATPNIVTTTNLSGAIAFTFSTAGAIGTTDIQDLARVTPLKSLTVNTATTVVAPIAAGGIWRITATYFTGA